MNALRVALGLMLFTSSVRANNDTPQWVEHNFARQHAALMHKVRTLIIPEVDWKNATIQQVLDDLSGKCKSADPNHRGVSLVGEASLTNAPIRVTVHEENKSLLEILKAISCPYSIGKDAIFFSYEWGDGFTRAEFYVSSNYFKTDANNQVAGQPGTYDVASQLAAKGVTLPPGARTTFLPDREKLVVVGGGDFVESIDEFLNP